MSERMQAVLVVLLALCVVGVGSALTGRAVAAPLVRQVVSCEGVYGSLESKLSYHVSRGRRIMVFGYQLSEGGYGDNRHTSLDRFCVVYEE